jgi:hypothetical protein
MEYVLCGAVVFMCVSFGAMAFGMAWQLFRGTL